LILGQLWKKNLCINHPIFKKRGIVSQNNTESLLHINVQRKPKPTVKNYQSLGYISYDATTSSWVTFSYELTGFANIEFSFVLADRARRDFAPGANWQMRVMSSACAERSSSQERTNGSITLQRLGVSVRLS
jgi:hypothetical protein